MKYKSKIHDGYVEAFQIRKDGPTPTPEWFKPYQDKRIKILEPNDEAVFEIQVIPSNYGKPNEKPVIRIVKAYFGDYVIWSGLDGVDEFSVFYEKLFSDLYELA